MGWGKFIQGVDCAPPHEIFKVELVEPLIGCPDTAELEKGFINIRINSSPSQCSDPTYQGISSPYRGSMTRSKNESVATKIGAKTPSLLQRAIKVASLENWVFLSGSALSKISEGIVASVTDLPYNLLIPDLEQTSGSYQHRLRTDRTDNGGTCPVLPTQGSKLHLDTSPLMYLNKGSKNKNFMFQSPLVMAVTIIGEALIKPYPFTRRLYCKKTCTAYTFKRILNGLVKQIE